MKTRLRRMLPLLFIAVFVSLTLTSCFNSVVKAVRKNTALSYQVPDPAMYADSTFTGIRDFIHNSPEDANILLIHGLSEKKSDHFDFMVERLATILNLKLEAARDTVSLRVKGSNASDLLVLGFDKWELHQWKFVHPASGKKVNFYFIFWAPITQPAKKFIHDYNVTEHRTGVSNLIKDQMFIDVFGDLALYLNTDCKVRLHEMFLQALEKINGNGDLLVVGGGFGVHVMFEALQLELDRRKLGGGLITKAASDTLMMKNRAIQVEQHFNQTPKTQFRNSYKIRKVFLVNNQLPFISLLTLRPEDQAKTEVLNAQVYWAMTNFCDQKRLTDPAYQLELISFYDPNDPFGYRLPPSTHKALRVNNISTTIAEYWQIDPKRTTDFVLPRLKSPRAADLFLSIVDQQRNTQDILFNLRGPSNMSRNDYRVIGALADGSNYNFVCGPRETVPAQPRNMLQYDRQPAAATVAKIAQKVIGRLQRKLEVRKAILPFSLPSDYRDTIPRTARVNGVLVDSAALITLPFEGLDVSVRNNSVTQLLTIHGVRNQEPDHFDELTQDIAKSLGFYGRPVNYRIVCAIGDSCDHVGSPTNSYRPGTVKISEFEGVFGKRLIVYNVYWSSITRPPKEWLDTTSIYREGSVVPRLVKQMLITDGFADIELTFRQFKSKVNATIAAAFKEMDDDFRQAGMSPTSINTYYMSGSLGSRLLLDFLDSARFHDTRVNHVQQRTRSWFMLTNQLIMTALKDVPFNNPAVGDKDNAISYADYYKATYKTVRHLVDDESTKFDIVAFNDPNDLLSFVVPDSVMGVADQTGRIYNNYLNLAQGVTFNMDQLIRYVSKADRLLQKFHKDGYNARLEAFKNNRTFSCNGRVVKLPDGSMAAQDYEDVLTTARDRFDESVFHEFFGNDSTDVDKLIIEYLKEEPSSSTTKLRKLLDQKKQYYVTDLYINDKQMEQYREKYKQKRKELGRKKVISRRNFRKLYEPGLVMPFFRYVANYSYYQDFVVDFGKAHVGAKNNSKIINMIAHGFESVTHTNVNQNLYEKVHKVK